MNLKVLFAGVLVITIGLFYFINQSNKSSAERVKQAEIAYQQKIEHEKQLNQQKAVSAAEDKQKKIETNVKIKDLQSKYSMDYLEAERIVNSKKMGVESKEFYANLSSRWSDALKVAGATGRIALSQPVKDMQQIKRDLEAHTTVTVCEAKLKQELLKSYDFAIDGFLRFMQKDEILSTGFISASTIFQERANALMDYC